MSSPDRMNPMPTRRLTRRRAVGLACAALLALSTAGCFRPMYAETSPGEGSALADKFGQIEIVFASGRVANEVRNDLIFELTGGAGNPAGAPYRLLLNVRNSTTAAAVVSPLTGLPEVELVTVDVRWQLYDVGNLKVPVATGNAIGKASLDSGYQRFARNRAIRDAENRSSRVAAESIRTQLAAYFVNPTAAAPVAAPPPLPNYATPKT
ncbi:Protein of unknown function DUF2159, secreted [Ancylobacter novellus DSM 506]|uniref:LPS-assembly lipoprotein n=1 Tax=Ancylobacter novellus (strain ATCC 8093 / DSM 506 / JCM 20403 / CCM 1077 / IAM 12100 / NBRC 12443 / NCIMB 10456) TaxID=639283 RepID=D6ZYV1_ANCN5|nr:LPS assembly lipoprotein LptE [Ancylobacter novellus]ADH91070.1 Protein of unknown function DUF2159, secreted [Ancylobacter novellus DSM 506]